MEGINVDQLAHRVLANMNKELGELMKGDCVFLNCGMQPPLDDEFRVVIEDVLDNGSSEGKHLIVMLETNGGYMETVERLVSVMRTHYKKVSFIIPNYAFSAGTVLALSGDAIYMDYYSVLGPIDPQYQPPEGQQFLPGVGYLAKFEELTKRINDPAVETTAELAYLVNNFDPARLFHIEQAINHGRTLITEWLPKYKFKNWKQTNSDKTKVTAAMKKVRAEKIATVLGDAKKWHSHGRGISMNQLSGASIKLEIDNFGDDPGLNDVIRNYHGLCVDYYTHKTGIKGYIHSPQGMRRVL